MEKRRAQSEFLVAMQEAGDILTGRHAPVRLHQPPGAGAKLARPVTAGRQHARRGRITSPITKGD